MSSVPYQQMRVAACQFTQPDMAMLPFRTPSPEISGNASLLAHRATGIGLPCNATALCWQIASSGTAKMCALVVISALTPPDDSFKPNPLRGAAQFRS